MCWLVADRESDTNPRRNPSLFLEQQYRPSALPRLLPMEILPQQRFDYLRPGVFRLNLENRRTIREAAFTTRPYGKKTPHRTYSIQARDVSNRHFTILRDPGSTKRRRDKLAQYTGVRDTQKTTSADVKRVRAPSGAWWCCGEHRSRGFCIYHVAAK